MNLELLLSIPEGEERQAAQATYRAVPQTLRPVLANFALALVAEFENQTGQAVVITDPQELVRLRLLR